MTGALDEAQGEATGARGIAESLGQDLAYCVASSVLSLVSLLRGETAKAVELAREVVSRAENTVLERVPGESWAASRFPSHYWLALCLMVADQLDEAGDVIRTGREFSEEHGNAWTIPMLHCASALRHFLKGEWDDAIAEGQTAIGIAGDVGTRHGLVYADSLRAMIAVHRDDLEEAQRWLTAAEQELAGSGPQYRAHWVAWAGATVHEARGAPEEALTLLAEAWDGCARGGFLSEYPVLGPDIVRVAQALGAPDRARATTEAVEHAAARMGVRSAQAAALRCRGLLEDDPDLLITAVTRSVEAQPFTRARTCEEAALALGRRGRTEKAVPLLLRAVGDYEKLRAARCVARCDSTLRALGVRRPRGSRPRRSRTGWEALTDTEQAVVNLAAQGLTNRQVGERMFISHRTVETHLSHAFEKLGVSSRARLASEVARRATAL